jgi:hypothetical protein
MATRKGTTPVNPPSDRLDETTAKGDKDSIAAAFDAAPAVTGPTSTPVSTKHDPTAPPPTAGKVIPLEPGKKMHVEPLPGDESLLKYQMVYPVNLTEHDLAVKMRAASALSKELDEVEVEKEKSNSAFNKRIKALEGQIKSLMREVNSDKGEKEFTCQKRVDYVTGIATIFDSETLEILDKRQLNEKERQVEMSWSGKLPPGRQGDTLGGNGKTVPFKTRETKETPAASAPAESKAEDAGETTPPPDGEESAATPPQEPPAGADESKTPTTGEPPAKRRGRPPKQKPAAE